MNYHIVGSDGNEYGPYSAEQLKGYVAEGRISLTTQARPAEGGDWKPLSSYPEFGGAPAAAPSAPAPALPTPSYSAPSYGAPAYAAPSAGGFPWELRQTLGFMPALTESVRMLALSPKEAFSKIQEKGDFVSPMLFGLLVSWAGILVSSIWQLLFGASMQSLMPSGMRGQMAGSAVQTVAILVLWPIIYVIALFIGAGINHLFLMLFGALNTSTSGFEGTLRTNAYSMIAYLASVIPVLGGLATLIWALILMVIGAQAMHKCSQGRAIAGIVVPYALCCVCMFAVMFLGVAAIMGAAGR
ncbi:MAG: hypothetical protein DIJKHBIC_02957 [Thermoanaerobaculia bacterium]|nr:hypothetical protein [Thermoanaerobaculia bacterium]